MKETENHKNNKKISFYISKNRYIDFLINTKTYKDLYSSKEALFSTFFAIIVILFINNIIFFNPQEETTERLLNFVGVLIGSVVGLLGFVIGGLALIVSSIGIELIETVDNANKFDSLMSIIFRFYFVGSVLGLTVIIQIITFLILLTSYDFNFWLTLVLVFFNSFFFIFSLIASIMLMGSCIRLMILQYKLKSQK
ncbi:TPA: hypothetical protein IUW16_000764 [Enterococcus faecalis]|nr:hypothetical protein [Enterococcus faecalis]